MDKKIEHIGTLSGKVLLFGGVYSNLQALEELRLIAKRENIPPSNCICTGDLVGYCAQPEETVQLFKNWEAKSIAGNVEIQLRNGEENCGCDFKEGSRCDGFSQLWYPFAQSRLSKDSLDYMKTLPDHIQFEYAGRKITVVHGSWFYVSEFIFKSTPWEQKQPNFDATQSDVIIAGHCGLPFSEIKNNRLWLNPGVIGMPANDGTPRVWYAILEDTNKTLHFKHYNFVYNNTETQQLMKKELLPEAYATTLLTGIWDNTEILPKIETQQQGKEIQF
ncbi:MAG: metallophosphoesterase family protein [Flavobacteriaceae bacterium]